jgi:hypothetical protein
MLGDGELAAGRGTQDVTMPGWHREPTLGIETERGCALEHGDQTLKPTFHHLLTLFSTVSPNDTRKQARQGFF